MDTGDNCEFINGGDGMYVAVDPRDNTTVYSGSQFGYYDRFSAGGDSREVRPRRAFGDPALRYNWNTPVILSPHNASASARFDEARKRRAGQELSLVLSGRWPMSCVNPTVLPGSGLNRWQPYAMERGPNS